MTFKMDMTVEELEGVRMQEIIVREAASKIADYIIAHHLPEILEKISPDAIATMTIAEMGAAVNETLKAKLPDKIVHIEHPAMTRIYQKGVFGGLKRIS